MTNHWRDFKNSDVFLVIGANPAENHPCGWKWAFVARDTRNARIIHVDPRFTRTSATADMYVPIRAGTDVAFFGGLISYIIENELYHEDYVRLHTNASFIVADGFEFTDGLFSGYDEENRTYDPETWDYDREPSTDPDQPGFARVDPTLQDSRCVFQLLREHYSRYTPEMVERVCGIPVEKFVEVAETLGSTGTADRVGNIVYAVGLTHHTSGVQIIRGAGIVQMLLGNVGRPGGGVNAERGHANIQGNTDNAISWEILPGYLRTPQPGMETIDDYIAAVAPKPSRPNAINYFGTNYRNFLVSLLQTWYGEEAVRDNDFAYSFLPKPAGNSSWLTVHNEARAGRLEGIIYSGFTGVTVGPDSNRMAESIANLKWMAILDPYHTTGSEFWKAPGVDPASIQTEVLFLPATDWIGKDGSFVNSGRWVQWKHKALPPEGEARDDNWILANAMLRLQDLYREEGGEFPDPVLAITMDYADPSNPTADEIAMEVNGRDLDTGLLLETFGDLRDDGSTTSGNWIYVGSFTEAGNQMDRRETDDPTGMGYFHNWTWSWPANRRVLYNRASADADGEPWDPTRPGIRWNGTKWVGDVPDFPPDSPPEEGEGAFIMTGEGVARLFAPGTLTADGPFPEHYEQTESPVPNELNAVEKHPVAFHYDDVDATFASVDDPEFPYVATTYRVTEHEHYVTQHVPYLVEAMPDFFVELPVELADEKGIDNGGRVRVRSKRGEIEGVAVVTKRMRPLRVGDGKVVYQVGIPLHWHYESGTGEQADSASMANLLTPYIGDANVRTPEYKGFLVNVERA
jgi:formate dehydrogenase major subunit